MDVVPFGRQFFDSNELASRIGSGRLGGKADGLIRIRSAVEDHFGRRPVRGVGVSIPRMTVIATDAFEDFMAKDGAYEAALSDRPDGRIAQAFQRLDLPTGLLGDLRALVEEVRTPLAVRSSSLLEDALAHPFAGVYETKMVPNNDPDPSVRFRGLVEAVKFVYASTFFRAARTYRRAVGADDRAERMAVLIQEVVGGRFGDRYYPNLSFVCRSLSYYPVGSARPEDGVAQLALGLGKTIVDGGVCWTYSPRLPTVPPPFASAHAMLEETQKRFWAVNMGRPSAYDPLTETEYLVDLGLDAAEYDATLQHVASTYDGGSDRLYPGTGRKGPRVVDFAPVLKLREWPINDALQGLLEVGSNATGSPVEMEGAVALPGDRDGHVRIGLVQVRAMAALGSEVALADEDLEGAGVLLATRTVMGNGSPEGIRDIVYLKPDAFDARATRDMAKEVDELNRTLMSEGRHYVLVGFGRWGSSDPWLGVPVNWGQVAGAKVIVESTMESMRIEPSQGSHFFHNMSSLGVVYLSVNAASPTPIDWGILATLPTLAETGFLRHVRTPRPLLVRVDGRRRLGLVRLPQVEEESEA